MTLLSTLLSTLLVSDAMQAVQEPGYYAGWGTLALLNAGLAQSKGSGGLFWFLVSLLLGPIATFLLVVFVEDRRRS